MKRQFSRGGRSSAIPGKLPFDNFAKQNLAVELTVVFYDFVEFWKTIFYGFILHHIFITKSFLITTRSIKELTKNQNALINITLGLKSD